ncbi:D-alanyl-D-alanine carboxypeptidase [Falsigemmobacter faecalis]|uniref:D-alanyl-D-alanine carboxypeptidase n=2 Tax=Falsigemmobacter faecalis TaxID=2488730 RepID=A0A3P3DFS4_9RHOB|nr:D-alanyl-D-alanine carboxypeptidase [Falsigemmobacter faecalis]
MDARTGQVIYEQNADTRVHPASLTKMLTLYITFDAIRRGEIRLDDMVTITSHAASQPPSRLGLRSGQRISVRHLIRAAAIKSANDAASALGDHISGNERAFAARMNRTAKALGMHRSSFRNAHGLTAEGHLSTARDMTLLGRRLFYDFPQHYPMFSRLQEDAGVARVNNTNRRFLEGYRGADGIKTGYTNAAGFNLTASAERNGKRLVATVMGGVSTAHRNKKMAELMDVGFGAAPNRVRSVPPPPVSLAAIADESDNAPGGAGKTIRLQTARATSPRPAPRPAELTPAPEMLAELTSGVADVLAALTTEPEPAAAPAALPFAVADLEPPPPRPDAVAAEPAQETPVTEVADAAQAVETMLSDVPLTQPRARPAAPDVAAVAEASPAPTPAPEGVAAALALANAAPLPEAAPAEITPAVVQLAEAAPEATTLPFQVVDEAGREVSPAPQDPQAASLVAAALPASVAELAEADLPEDMPVPPADDDNVPLAQGFTGKLVVPALSGERPRARPGEIVMTMARAETTEALPSNVQRTSATTETREVVSRVSTSGGRHWAITLGKFNTRGTAERALLQTALSETRALEGALRKINQKGGGWEATFAGLTRDQADLACRRLQARAINCFTLGP